MLNSTSQYRSTTFHVVNSHMWLVATVMDNTTLDYSFLDAEAEVSPSSISHPSLESSPWRALHQCL